MPAPVEPHQVLLPGRQSMLIRLTCKEGMRPALLDVLNAYTDSLADEPGTEMFMLSLDPDDANNVWLYEIFRDERAADEHRQSPGFSRLMKDMPDVLAAQPAVLRMNPLRVAVQDTILDDGLADAISEDWT